MKKILVKFLLFFVIILTIVINLNNIVPCKSQSEKIRIDSLISVLDSVESITLGRSHAGSLDYDYWGKYGFNLALGGRDFASIKYLIEFIEPKANKLNELIIFISYSSFYFDNTAISKGNLNDARKALYYSIPSIELIDKSDISNFVFGKFLPFIQADHGYSLLKQNLLSNYADKIFIEKNWAEGYMDSLEIVQSAIKQVRIHSGDRYTAESYTSNIIEKNKSILIDIIEFVNNQSVELIFVTPSYHNSYTEMFPQKDISEMKSIMMSLANQYDVEYIDLSNDSTLSGNNIYYHNADHMNNLGKKLFTLRLQSLLNANNKK